MIGYNTWILILYQIVDSLLLRQAQHSVEAMIVNALQITHSRTMPAFIAHPYLEALEPRLRRMSAVVLPISFGILLPLSVIAIAHPWRTQIRCSFKDH